MQRKIKFRVFLKPEHWDDKGLMTNGLPLGGWDKWYINLDEPLNEACSLDGEFTVGEDIEIMQYTGLKDRNGKEIYESDIVRVPTIGQTLEGGDYGIYIVVFGGGAFTLQTSDGAPNDLLFDVSEECEVIGNVYEDPELLKL